MKKFTRFAIWMLLLAIFVVGVSATSAQDDWWATAGAPYAGTTIHGVTESTPPSTYAAHELAQQFEAATGIKVDLELTSWDQMYDKGIKDMQAGTGIYDFVYIEQDIIYSYLANHWLTDITQMMADNPDLVDPNFSFDNFTSFLNYFKDGTMNDDVFGIPMEAFVKPYLYRLDLFNDPDIKAAYLEQYGHELAPATTHEEYTQIAEFFTQWGKDHDMNLWGSTVQASTSHTASFYELVESVFPTFGVYNWGINMDNWKSSVADGGMLNSDKAKEALTWWTNLLQYAPPESTQSTWDEVAATFAAGRAAQGLVYGENAVWIANDPDRSQVVGEVGVALPPLEPGVMDDAKAGTGYIGYYDGGAFGMPETAPNKEATLLWLQFISQESVQADWAIAGSRITLTATYDEPKVQEFDAKTDHYFTKMKEDGYLYGGAPPFPFHADIREIIAPYVWKAISGELSVSDALDQAAAAADAELVNLGYGM
jgi:multiple sugar transport system substrate-binding protein